MFECMHANFLTKGKISLSQNVRPGAVKLFLNGKFIHVQSDRMHAAKHSDKKKDIFLLEC